ncbi:tyrosine-type recombinase/integrase [Ligilactobacillus salivarius]|uniref:tyrosine-type recombinase/integrase n=1 Tax=Ligilactobacillus salivarius TaxID=1624 RepID=UPI0001DBC586|nr:tyrosine-type recombinase/integrase [Ligilactobacillus salivarius]ADJ79638.1 Phage integrase [Ligilactobacillus salivarius CECT 5713]MBM6709129.1 site-specific integrase [Ligilactobacillus salivarius]MYU79931.1 site-specific integrase [Ligilactobacillus salivarius]MYV08092.1 site-specific integrase [Ligilactobacillus salivarius]MYV14907.1 site-specific integrase [Ligilactobacillus salivarius]
MTKIIKYTNKDNETLYKFRFYAGLDELTGKQRYIRRQGFKSEKDAKTELLKIEYLVSTNQYFKSVKSGKFGDVLDEWLALHKETVKASTWQFIELRANKHVRPYFKDMYVDKITLRQCQDFVNKTFKVAPVAYVYSVSIVKNTLDYALRLGMIESNPMLYVIKPKKQANISDNHGNYYNKDELKKFLDVAKNTNLKKYALFRLLAYSGMRIGECLALTWHDLDYKNNTIAINKTLARTNNGIKIQTPKTKASNRVISLDNETIQVLKMWQLEQRKQLLKVGINAMDSKQLIFSNGKNSFIIVPTVRLAIKQIAKKAGIHSITTHGFRHTHATLLFASGLDIKQVQARLGHSNVQTTLNIYTHAMKEKQDKIGDEFAKYINF